MGGLNVADHYLTFAVVVGGGEFSPPVIAINGYAQI